MNILLLGKDGQLGQALQKSLHSMGNLISIGRAEQNLEDFTGLCRLLELHKPQIIVNAAAYTSVDKAESEEQKAFLINADLVAILADYAHKNDILLIHYSTDYVFDGKKQTAYVETDPTNPQNIYGMSKLAGEKKYTTNHQKIYYFKN